MSIYFGSDHGCPEVPELPTLPGRFLPSGDEIGQQLEGGGGPIDGPAI